MSHVNIVTGEVIDFDKAAAERRAERITLRLEAIADNYRAVLPMIREAIEKRDDLALGYRSPGDYVSDRFGQALSGLGLDVRRAVVGELTQAGLSSRAIAPVVGVGASTVKRDAQVAHVGHLPQAPEPATTGEGVPRSGQTPQGEVADVSDVTAPSAQDAAPPRPAVTGIDGKTYAAPKRPVPRPEAEKSLNALVMHAERAAREAKALTPDQIRRIKPKADLWTVGLRSSIEALQRLADSLDTKEPK